MTTKKLINFFNDKWFRVYLEQKEWTPVAEIETRTDWWVNMIINLNPFTIKEFEETDEDNVEFCKREAVELYNKIVNPYG